MNEAIDRGLVGRWRLLRWERFEQDGAVTLPFGQSPIGVVIYSSDGYMAVQIMKSDDGRRAASASQTERASARSYIAYCGKYEVNDSSTEVRHFVEASVNANWVGGEQIRRMLLEGDSLALSVIEDGKPQSTLYWTREAHV